MAVDQLTGAASQARDLETELSNTVAHAAHGLIILSWVPDVNHQFVNWPDLDLHLSSYSLSVRGKPIRFASATTVRGESGE